MIIYKNFPLHKMSYLRVGGKVSKIYIPEREKELDDLFSSVDPSKKIVVFGLASNFLLPDVPADDCVFISLKKMRDKMEISETEAEISSGYNLMELIYKSAAKGTGENLFPLSGIPGTLGGCVFVNAGGSNRSESDHIGNWVKEVRVYDIRKRKVVTFSQSDLQFSYRHSALKDLRKSGTDFIILDMKIKLIPTEVKGSKMKIMKFIDMKLRSQPVGEHSLGCVFKNPPGSEKPAWEFIAEIADDSHTCGKMSVSTLHRNFIINNSEVGSSADFMNLVEMIKSSVNKKFNISLEREVEYFSDYY